MSWGFFDVVVAPFIEWAKTTSPLSFIVTPGLMAAMMFLINKGTPKQEQQLFFDIGYVFAGLFGIAGLIICQANGLLRLIVGMIIITALIALRQYTKQ